MRLLRALLLAAALVVLSLSEETPEEEGEEVFHEEDEQDDGLELPEDEEVDQNDPVADTESPEALLTGHEKGRECLNHAEELEKEHGFFDDQSMPEDSLQQIIDGMDSHAHTAFGERKKADFKEKLQVRLQQAQKNEENFGAQDACVLMMRHHDEL
mmetsp:Transcript_38832/g.88305  ORF Transcript_38832/g.88305 Transcript_38832/m.88305 type:complete len:156 (-) Transcript_38832:151-618(-)